MSNFLVNRLPPYAISRGVYTADDLKARFGKVAAVCKRFAKIDDNGGGNLSKYILSYLQSLVTFEVGRI